MTDLAEREGHAARVATAFIRIAVRMPPSALELFEDWLHCCATFDENHPSATGCLLALVREAWDDHRAYVSPFGMTGRACMAGSPDGGEPRSRLFIKGATEAEALVAALEAAP